MNKKKFEFVSQGKLRSLLKKGQYLLCVGERSNGKSYAAKSLVINDAIHDNRLFIYLRRYDLDIKDSVAVNYFADLNVEELTDGEYTTIDVFRKGIYLANIDEKTLKVKRGKKIGFCQSLSGAEHIKSLQYPEVGNILFEEFLPKNGQYLFDEPNALQHHVSTIFRLRTDGKVILVGNTLTRICPYYSSWGMDRVRNMKLNSIDEYVYPNDEGPDTKVIVYRTDSLGFNSGMFFGSSAKNISGGGYETDPQPKLPKPRREYKVIYDMVIQYEYMMFYLQLLQDLKESNNIVWFVTPKTTPIKPGTRIITTDFSTDPMVSRFLVGLTPNEQQIFNMIKAGRVCYSDDLTGTEFKIILKNFTTGKNV